MPRKTRKQKEKTAIGKQAQSIFQPPVKGEFKFNYSGIDSTMLKLNTVKKSDNSYTFSETSTTLHDLGKSLIFALIIFSLELVIYFAKFKN